MKKLESILAFISLLLVLLVPGELWSETPVDSSRFIAGESVVFNTTDPGVRAVYEPSIVIVDKTQRIVIAFNAYTTKREDLSRVYTSDDGGVSWDYRDKFPLGGMRLFKGGTDIFVIGHVGRRGDLGIAKSSDDGVTWSEFNKITQGEHWHVSSTNFIDEDRYVYTAIERNDVSKIKGWDVSEFTPVLLRGDKTVGLLKPEAWTYASEFPFCEVVEDHDIGFLGIPFYPAYYPNTASVQRKSRTFGFSPAGWLESNIVQITDPEHYWYDPTGKTFHIFSRANTGRTNLATVVKAVEQSDGSIKTMFETAPSGEKLVYTPFPGGQMKFFVLYDDVSELYWLVSTQSVDSMTRAECLSGERFGCSDNERRRLQLSFSRNMIDWCFAGIVAMGPSEKQSRHYASMAIRGDDLLILSRSGNKDAHSAHDGNMITFHKVEDFRNLVY